MVIGIYNDFITTVVTGCGIVRGYWINFCLCY